MAIRILGSSSELTLIFDRPTFRCSKQQIRDLSETLRQVEGVESIEMRAAWYRAPRIRVVFNAQTEANTILRRMAIALRTMNQPTRSREFASHLKNSEVALEEAFQSENRSSRDGGDQSDIDRFDSKCSSGSEMPIVRNRLREAGYGVLAIGAFTMSWIGLILPVIPTIPFVVLTAHFAVQSSPKLRNRLLRSRLFGPMMRDWQEHRAIRRVVQLQAYFFTTIIIVVGFVLAPAIPIIYGIMVIGSFMAIFAVSQIPVIEVLESHEPGRLSNGTLQIPTGIA